MKLSAPVFIFGAGKLGLLVSMVARLQGLDYTTYDIIKEKTLFASGLGINAKSLRELKPEQKAEVCIDCTGSGNIRPGHRTENGLAVLHAGPAAARLERAIVGLRGREGIRFVLQPTYRDACHG